MVTKIGTTIFLKFSKNKNKKELNLLEFGISHSFNFSTGDFQFVLFLSMSRYK